MLSNNLELENLLSEITNTAELSHKNKTKFNYPKFGQQDRLK